MDSKRKLEIASIAMKERRNSKSTLPDDFLKTLEERTGEIVPDLKPGRQRPRSKDETKILLMFEKEYGKQNGTIQREINQVKRPALSREKYSRCRSRQKQLLVSVEIPDNYLEGSYDKVRDVLTDDGCIVHMISPEDIFCDRLRALVHWKEKEQLKWMTKLYEGNDLNQGYIYSRLVGIKEKEVADVFFNTIKEQEQEQ